VRRRASGARGTIAELALRLREVIDGQMDFGAAQDDKDQVTPRLRSFSFEPTGAF
jgi:hypothetical protein